MRAAQRAAMVVGIVLVGWVATGRAEIALVEANAIGADRWCRSNGDGTFSGCAEVEPGASSSVAVALGDLNGDGWADAVFGRLDQRNSVCLMAPDGTAFADCFDVGLDAYDATGVALGDLDEDGTLDIVFANFRWDAPANDAVNRYCLNDGSGGFSCQTVSLFESHATHGLELADVNGDDHLDAVFLNEVSYQICLGRGDGSFFPCQPEAESFLSGNAIALGDLDGDSHPDAVIARGAFQRNLVCPGQLSGGFGSCVDFGDVDDTTGVELADLDGDGRLDAVLSRASGQANAVCLGLGDLTFADCQPVQSSEDLWLDLAIADLDADGNLDVVFAGSSSNVVCQGAGDGTFFGCSPVSPAANLTSGVALAELDQRVQTIFGDGFESGDTGSWSGVSP